MLIWLTDVGEGTLPNGAGTCLLGSHNLTQYVKDGVFSFSEFEKYVRLSVRFADNINVLSDVPLPDYKDYMLSRRRIGLGIMGWGSVLYMLKIRFGSPESAALRDKIMKSMTHSAIDESVNLAIEKGMAPACEPDKHAEGKYFKNIELPEPTKERIRKHGIRNTSLFSIQPNGNSSIFANVVSGGLEPLFSQEYIRTSIVSATPDEIKDATPNWAQGILEETEMFKFVNEGDEQILRGISPSGTVFKIDQNRGLTKETECMDYGVRYLKSRNDYDPSADYAVTAMNLNAQDHVNDLEGFSRWIDSAVSKTINVPFEYPFEDFKSLYLDGFESGVIKGLTTYRTGTMTSVLSVKEEKTAVQEDEEIILEEAKLNDSSPAVMKTLKTNDGGRKKWYLTVVHHENTGRPVAFFAHTNHHEKTVQTNDALDRLIDLAQRKGIKQEIIDSLIKKMEGDNNVSKLCRAISLNLRHGVLIKNVVQELDKVETVVGSFLFQIRKFLGSYIKDGEKVQGEVCDNCGSDNVVYKEGCKQCGDCGNSKCG